MISSKLKTSNRTSIFVCFKTFLSILFLAAALVAQGQTNEQRSIHVGLFYPISNHGVQAAQYTNVFSLNAIAGVSRAEKGLTIGGVTNVIKENASGFQIAGVSNHLGGSSRGLLIAGVVNTYDSAAGFQVAGLTNIARNRVKGAQLAGLINTAETVDGVQIAGLVNKAKKVKGVQLAGLVNIADSSDYPIGIINIIKNGEKSVGISIDETLTTLATFRSGGRVLYGILGVGYNFKNSDDKYALEGGIGAHIGKGKRFRVNAEAVTVNLSDFKKGNYSRSALRLMPAFKISPNLEIFAGPSVNFIQTNTPDGKSLTEHYIWDHTSGNNLKALYVGGTGGLQWIW
ncbi:hypothetical protein HUW51_19430 [Adhaeribacter swui]|uniref:Uncharacterized protein n=1 Tax=Adhaeribacter swui TaxID=2086471 RepID=A0A7G7GCA8_9BACT|nr:hypothetical protein [Adhaeribacter swui]QNF34792.1 hypothetical protein HUW51_19430 [Adhaeribacter swui]